MQRQNRLDLRPMLGPPARAPRSTMAAATARPDPDLVRRLEQALRDRGVRTHVRPTVTTDALLRQPDDLVARWAGARASSGSFVGDGQIGRSWTDAFTAQESPAQARADRVVVEAALDLVGA